VNVGDLQEFTLSMNAQQKWKGETGREVQWVNETPDEGEK
jgi:hypothetical protein